MEEWLASIGLAERIPAFREHRITPDLLGDLTDEDLRELGLTIGERRRFQRAIQTVPTNTPPAPAAVPAAGSGEHRPLTVMFADLVGSTSLGERLDPEDLLEVMRVYREFCGEAIARYGGHLARFLGDGILAYFCYPIANENDPERAVRAALDIVRGVGALRSAGGGELQVRIGLATGRVTVRISWPGRADPNTIIGSCPNLAARLQALAQPNEIIIAERTHERIASHFACEPLGAVEIRGFEQPHEVWRVVGERTTRQVREALETEAQPPRSSAARRSSTCCRSCGARPIMGTAAPPSCSVRLESESRASCSTSSTIMRPMLWSCKLPPPPSTQIAPCGPLRTLGPIGWHHCGGPPLGRDGEAGSLAQAGRRGAGEGRFSGDAPRTPRSSSGAAALRPEQLRERTIEVLVEHLLTLSADRPTCLVVEDLHWLDPTSAELVKVCSTNCTTITCLLCSPPALKCRPSGARARTRLCDLGA